MEAAQLRIGGITPFSATDFPGRLAATVFVQGCPWRCGYCHNPHLQTRTNAVGITWSSVMDLLKRRAGLLDAVVFSGGEATVDPALPAAIAAVRSLGMAVGLHTAGVYPRQLAAVLPLVDWVGFDVKAPFEDYAKVTGVNGSGEPARECARLIIASGVEHECRTTVHPALLSEPEIEQLAASLAAAGVRNYALQMFRALGCGSLELKASAASGYISEAAQQRIAAHFEKFTFRLPG